MIIRSKKQGSVTFVFDGASNAKKVFLAGTFNHWDPTAKRMTKSKDGTFKSRLELEPGRYEYKFVVDGQWRNDTNGEETAPNEFGETNNVVQVS
ncbi:MAG: isoamylase early set domain-containing protein [Sedimentisphaerales bacterium]|nr:isoamylase early set domain-containing protein [Sedimentisphaerales bacterium]